MSVRHDWYQSDEKVVVTVLLKNAVEKNYKCDINKTTLRISADNYELNIELFGEVDSEKSSHKATPHKIEITLVKQSFGKWMSLEKKAQAETAPVKVYSGKKPDEWDKLAKDIEKNDDKEEGEAAVNSLFKKIYESGTEEQRKAMNKSFQESGGTVLSTNWDEVKKDKVDVKPPDGCEFKKWE